MKIPAPRAAQHRELSSLPAWSEAKIRAKADVIHEAQNKKGLHCITQQKTHKCHLSHAGVFAKTSTKDNVQDDTGCQALFTEQGASASQTAVTVLDTISRLLGLAREANDAVSACTQVIMEVAPRLLKLPGTECFTMCVILPRTRRPAQRDKIDDPVVLLEGHLYGHPLAGLLWERKLEELLLLEIREHVKSWECLYFHRKTNDF